MAQGLPRHQRGFLHGGCFALKSSHSSKGQRGSWGDAGAGIRWDGLPWVSILSLASRVREGVPCTPPPTGKGHTEGGTSECLAGTLLLGSFLPGPRAPLTRPPPCLSLSDQSGRERRAGPFRPGRSAWPPALLLGHPVPSAPPTCSGDSPRASARTWLVEGQLTGGREQGAGLRAGLVTQGLPCSPGAPSVLRGGVPGPGIQPRQLPMDRLHGPSDLTDMPPPTAPPGRTGRFLLWGDAAQLRVQAQRPQLRKKVGQ